MDEVKIYTYTNIKGPGKRSGAFTYILETETSKGPATLNKTELIEASENLAELTALFRALQRLTKSCILTIYTDSQYVAAGYTQKRIENWIKTGWLTAKGTPVANKEEWQKTAELLGRHMVSFVVGEWHSYKGWLARETEKKTKEREGQTCQRQAK